MKLNEAEIQLLASIARAEDEGMSCDRDSLEQGGERYWIYREDWAPAYASLADKELIAGDDTGYRLTRTGEPLARDYYAERPDRYWYYYREFYSRAHESRAHSSLCERVFGLDLGQEGQMDMAALDGLLQRLRLEPGEHLLDIGCGAGGIARYIAEQTGSRVSGLDYSADAIEVARQRAAGASVQADFARADINALELAPRSVDAVVMIDSIYWASDTSRTLQQIIDALRPGGRLAVVIALHGEDRASPGEFEIDRTFVARALDKLGIEYDAVDGTREFIDFWIRQKRALDDLRDEFIAEGNEFIHLSLSTEAETEFLPAIDSGTLRRYLYFVRRPD